jgi:hypothetical protein
MMTEGLPTEWANEHAALQEYVIDVRNGDNRAATTTSCR